jgi:RHS repeat-associated protein
MRAWLAVLLLVAADCAYPQSSNFVWDYIGGGGDSHWVASGDTTFESSSGGAYIWNATVSGANGNDYEVNTTLTAAAAGATFMHFLRANSTSVAPGVGSYVSVELALPSGWKSGGSVQMAINQCVNGTVTQLGGTSVPLNTGDRLRSVVYGTTLWVFINTVQYGSYTIPSTTGKPGYGGYSFPYNDSYYYVQLGHHDTVAPNTVVGTTVATSLLPTSASLRWQGVADDSVGIGVFEYTVSRNGTPIATIFEPDFADATVQPSTSYTYSVAAVDYHGNVGSAATISVTTPPAGAVDPRRVGVQTNGSYWGGAGEQINMLNGDLNFMLSIEKAMMRGGLSLPINLIYDSQNWRQDNGVNWNLGADVGYGYGWKLLFGSITPYYTSYWTGVDHYVYTDVTGAEYRLDQNNNGIWSSTQGVYVWFDQNANKLHFRDGTWWLMGSTSGGTEADAGTMYPTTIEDVNGNQILVSYVSGAGTSYPNSSARVNQIQDTRASTTSYSYQFNWNTDSPVPHLASIYDGLYGSRTFSFTYASASLGPPFGSDPNYNGLTTTHLATALLTGTYQFTYDSAGAGELNEVTFPFGGHLRWSYQNDLYSGSRYLRAVGTRYLAADSAGATEWTYPITWDNASSGVLHAITSLTDASGNGSKTWHFTASSSAPVWQLGLLSEFVQKPSVTSGTIFKDDTLTWSQDPAGNPYVSSKTSVTDEGTSNQQSALSTQTLDQYGNVTQSVIYPYNNTTTPLKTYTNTYMNSSTYVSNYIFNRLSTTTLTPLGGSQITLLQNYYPDSNPNWAVGSVPTNPAPHVYDNSPPIPANHRGLVYATSTPSPSSSCWNYYQFSGAISSITCNDGKTLTSSSNSGTNYSAPQALSTESYSETIGYTSWLGVTQTTGANGEQINMTYDSAGRPVSAVSPYWTSGTVGTTSWQYNWYPLPATTVQTGTDGVTTSVLDGLGRPIHVGRGDSSGVKSYTDTLYAPCACSPLGKVQQVSQPYPPGTPSNQIAWTIYTYDGIGRTLTTIQPDGASTTTNAYSGNQTTVTDPAGNWKQLTSDVSGNLTLVVEPDPANQPSGTLSTSYTYDWMNNVTGVTMTRGTTTQTRTFVYNNAGQLTSATNPENGTVTYTYNGDGTLQYKHDAKGQDTVYTYDQTTKKVVETQYYPTGKNNAEDGCQRVNYYYTSYSGDTENFIQYATGRLAAVTYFANCLTPYLSWSFPTYPIVEMFSYHPAGGVTGKRTQVPVSDPNSPTGQNVYQLDILAAYDGAGRISAMNYPGLGFYGNSGCPYGSLRQKETTMLSYSYDTMGRQSSIQDQSCGTGSSQPYFAQNTYDYAGRLSTLTTGSGSINPDTETLTYNQLGQISSLAWNNINGGAYAITYTYSATQNNGQITHLTDTISGETITYQYDALKRLTSASSTPTSGSSASPYTQTFLYDGFGNLTAKVLNGTTTPISVNSGTNQLANSYYDANGNMTSGSGASFGYDEANRISSAYEVSGGGMSYGYSPQNKRVVQMTSNTNQPPYGLQYALYGIKGEKLVTFYAEMSDYNPDGTLLPVVTVGNAWAGKRLLYENGNSVIADRLGTNRANSARFLPYGEELTSTANDHVKFATYTRDSYTGLDYAGQRYYASTYGNFTSPDPSMDNVNYSNPASWNAYTYTMGSPVNSNDPSGLVTCGSLISESNGESLNQIMTTDNDLGYLAQDIWAEAGPVRTSDASNPTNFDEEQGYIATVMENRYAIANGELTAYTTTGAVVNPNLFGGPGTTLTQVIMQASGNNQSWGIFTNGQLTGKPGADNSMFDLQNILNASTTGGTQVQLPGGGSVNSQCYAVLSAASEAIAAQNGLRTEPTGDILTYFQVSARAPWAGSTVNVGRLRPLGNDFWGYLASPPPPPVRRPPLPVRGRPRPQ